MKIAYTGDNHVFCYGLAHKQVSEMMAKISGTVDAFCVIGDIGEILLEPKLRLETYEVLLKTIDPTVFVWGNHDLYNSERLKPEVAMNYASKLVKMGHNLQPSWTDDNTFFLKDNTLFVGSIGFPDFKNPKFLFNPKYYDFSFPTCDGEFMDLSLGWTRYTNLLIKAFQTKLDTISRLDWENLVVLTHYPVFESQYMPSGDEVSAYFFCHSIGDIVKKVAATLPQRKVFCLAGHGHEFCTGRWGQEGINIFTHGLNTRYGQQKYISFDTQDFS